MSYLYHNFDFYQKTAHQQINKATEFLQLLRRVERT